MSYYGKAVKQRISLAFVELRKQGFYCEQDVTGDRHLYRTRRTARQASKGAYESLMQWLYAPDAPANRREVVRRAEQTGVVYYTREGSSDLNAYRRSFHVEIHYARLARPGSPGYAIGMDDYSMECRVTEALKNQSLELYTRADNVIVVTGVAPEVFEAADAAHHIGGFQAEQAVMYPNRRKRPEDEEE